MASTTIRDLHARRIFDGCARPSLEVVVTTDNARVRAAPSYSDPRSSGKYEINHFPASGVQGSIDLINSTLRDELIGWDATAQRDIDQLFLTIDGSDRFSTIGGNTAEACSMAIAKAAAASVGIPLYRHVHGDGVIGVPHQMPNIIGGGATMGDSGWKGRTPDLQDHIILPLGCQSTYQEMVCVCEVFHRVGLLLQEADPTYSGGRDEEYCWLPGLDEVTCLTVLKQACDEVAMTHGVTFRLGLDVGAADLWNEADQVYHYAREGVQRTPAEHARFLGDLVDRFDLFYMEDSFYEDHVDLYVEQMHRYGDRVLVAGDDLLAGNLSRLEQMAGCGAINAAVIKLNMCGTVTRTAEFVARCKEQGFATIGSCRTYDSPDDTLADLIVGWGCNSYKCGSPAGGEHAAKTNRYMRIDEQLGDLPSFVAFPGVLPG